LNFFYFGARLWRPAAAGARKKFVKRSQTAYDRFAITALIGGGK